MSRPPPPILCIVGKKNTGKTHLTVALASELNRRGYRIMTVKYGHGFQVDQAGKDSWRHRHEGGAFRSVLAGPRDFAVVGRWPHEPLPLRELVRRFLSDADLVLAEGARESDEPRVEVHRRGDPDGPWADQAGAPGGPTLALVTDDPALQTGLPTFQPGKAGHIRALAELVERQLLRRGGGP